MLYPVKIEFKEYPSGSWTDWSQYLIGAPTINRRVESENEGEAGIITFDNADVVFKYESGNPVHSAFSIDLSSKQRYLFKISALKSNKTYVQLFEGMADFSTIEWEEDKPTISFEITDKLSALALLLSKPVRGAQKNLLYDKNTDTDVDNISITTGAGDTTDHHKWFNLLYKDDTLIKSTVDSNTPALGDVIQSPWDGESLAIVKYKGKPAGANGATDPMYLDVINFDPTYPTTSAGNQKIVNNLFYYINEIYGEDLTIREFRSSYDVTYKDGGNTITVTLGSGYEVVAYEGLKLIEVLVKSQWPEISIVNNSGVSSFPIPLEYYLRLIDENPLGGDPLEALKTLADTMSCYIFINRSGNLVIQSKDDLVTAATSRSIGNTKIFSLKKKYFWDKLVDGVTVKIKSWVQDENGDYLEGSATVTKQIPGNVGNIKPKNEITKELLTDSASDNSQELLDAKAATKGTDILDFYGDRHAKVELDLHIDDNVLEWELIDNLTIDTTDYFFTALSLDLAGRRASLTPVEIEGHDYDIRQIVVGLSESNSVSNFGGSGSGTQVIFTNDYGEVIDALDQLNSTPGILVQTAAAQFTKRNVVGVEGEIVVTNGNGVDGNITIGIDEAFLPVYTFNPPLSLSGTTVSLLYSDNFQLASGTTFDTIQPIKTDSDVQFGTLGLGGVIEAGYKLKVHGVAKFTSDIWVDGDIYVGGNVNQVNEVELNVQDRVINLNVGGTDTTAIGGGIDLLGTSGVSVASITHDGSYWQFSDEIVAPDIKVTNRTANGIAYFDGSKWLVEHASYFSWNDTTKVLGITGDIAMSGNKSIYNNFTSGIFGSGFILGYNITNSGGSYIELDNGRFRGTLAVHIFKKDIVKTANGYLLVTDSATVGRETQSPYLYVKQEDQNATFAVNDLLYTKDIDTNYNDGNGLLVKEIKSKVTWVGTETINNIVYDKYQLSFADGGTGTYQDYKTGMTIARVNKGFVLIDASSEFSPFIDIYDDITTWADFMSASKLKARSGKLSGVTSTNFGALSGHGYWSNRVYLEGNCYVAGNLWAFTGGIGGTYSSPKVKISSSGMVVALDSASATFLGVSAVSIGQSGSWFGIAYRDSSGDYVFTLGSSNIIANWTFTKEKFSNGDVRLEASATLKGLAVTKTIETVDYDVIMIGDHSISNPTISENIEGKFFSNTEFSSASGWTIEQGPFSITQNATSFFNGDSTVNYNQSVLRVPAISLTATGGTDVDGHVSQGIYSVYIEDYQGVYVVINTRIRRDEYNWGVESVNEDYQLRFMFKVNTTSGGLKIILNETIDTGAIDLATWTEFKWRLKLPDDFIDSASDLFNIDVIAPHPKDGSTVRYNVVAVDYIRFTMYEPLNTFYASPSGGVVMKSDPFNYFQFTDSLTELKVDNLLINGYRPPRYRGELSADPTYDNVPGDEYYNSTTSKLKKYITSVGYINLN